MDFSIVIAHRGPWVQLWTTISNLEIELQYTLPNAVYEYCIVCNGDGPLTPEVDIAIRMLEKHNKLGYVGWHNEPVAAPLARQEATEHAQGNLLFFFDNHILVEPNYFRRVLADFDHYGDSMDMLHSVTKYYADESSVQYHYKLELDRTFWASSAAYPVDQLKPYRIAAGGHGGFIVRRSVWEATGGYASTPFRGYAGEEIYYDFKAAMLDKTNWLDPRLVHWHFPGSKSYPRHHSDDYYRNLMMCANIIGGQSWLQKVYANFAAKSVEKGSDDFVAKFPSMNRRRDMYKLMMEAEEASREHAIWLAGIRHRTLEEQLTFFRNNAIAMD